MTISVSGTAYASDRSTALTGTARTVGLRVNGGSESTTTTNTGDGTFSFASVTASDGDTITLYLKGETEKANAICVTDGSTNIASVKLADTWINIRSADRSGHKTTIVDASDWDYVDDSTNMLFTATAGSPNTFVIRPEGNYWIESGHTWKPTGNCSGGGGSLNDYIVCAGTWEETDSETCTLSTGSRAPYANFTDGTFVKATGEFIMNSNGGGALTAGSGGLDFYKLTFKASGGGRSIQVNGTVTVNNTLLVDGCGLDNGTSTVINAKGDVIGSVALGTVGGGTGNDALITMNGTVDQYVTCPDGYTMCGIEVNKASGDVIFPALLTMSAQLILTTDTFDFSTNSTHVRCVTSGEPYLTNNIGSTVVIGDLTVNVSGGSPIARFTGTWRCVNLTHTQGRMFSQSAGILEVTGNVTMAATAGAAGSSPITLKFVGSGAQAVTWNDGAIFSYLSMDKDNATDTVTVGTSGTVVLGSATYAHNLTLNKGTLIFNGCGVNVYGTTIKGTDGSTVKFIGANDVNATFRNAGAAATLDALEVAKTSGTKLTFVSSSGWTAVSLTANAPGVEVDFTNGMTYIVSGAITMRGDSTGTVTVRSTTPASTYALKFTGSAASVSLAYVDAQDWNNATGTRLWSYRGANRGNNTNLEWVGQGLSECARGVSRGLMSAS